MSELALQLIAKEKKEKTGTLDLGKCGLSKIPKQLSALTHLTILNFSNYVYYNAKGEYTECKNEGENNQITKLENLPASLQSLYISFNGSSQ